MVEQVIAKTLLEALFPICRSLTGEGNRKTFAVLSEYMPLNLVEVPSGTKAFDWVVPEEWNIRDAWIKDEAGNKIVDFQKNNLSVVSYSTPIRETLSFQELEKHLHTLPGLPDAIPYRTSYFKRNWGFCLSHVQFQALNRAAQYQVCIDSELNPKGSLTYADLLLKGATNTEILVSTYCCHPSMANDNLSGIVLTTLLYRYLAERDRYYSYRFVIAPETLGVIVYLSENLEAMKRVVCGTVVTNVGGRGALGLKPSFVGNHAVDRLARMALKSATPHWKEYPFVPDGSDERQYSSPGFRIPTVSITKDKYYDFVEYHTSKDNLDFVRPEQLMETFAVYKNWFENVEMNRIFTRTNPYGEYQLGALGLYPSLGGAQNQVTQQGSVLPDVEALSWIMFGCDGKMDLLSIAEKSGMPLEELYRAAKTLRDKGRLTESPGFQK